MSDEEHAEWIAQRKRLVIYLQATQQQIIDYPPRANDADYRFLLTKAAYYQRMIDTIDNILKSAFE
jgi:hypothetical protein